jgi:hypothetical protein
MLHRHGKSSNIAWTFSMLPRETTLRFTEISKKLPEFHYEVPEIARG